MKPLEEAQSEVLAAVPPLSPASVPLRECLGLVLAEPVAAPHDLPPFANSAMDGYAVRVADIAAAPVDLPVLEDVPAGSVATHAVAPGTAIKIMTGAPMPEGAEAVVRVEDTTPGDGMVRIQVAVPAGTSVRPAGGDVAAGTPVFAAGTRLGPAHLGMLASLGVAHPPVRRRPLVAIMSTGDEIEPPETATLRPGKIRDSNRFVLRGLLEELGAIVVDHGIVGDDAVALNRVLGHAAANADIVLTSGGVSMGDYDLVKAELAKLGTVEFWKVAMQPAKPFAFGTLGDTPLFGLPGNPVSVFVAFEQFVRPALLHMMGARALFRPRIRGVMDHEVSTDPEKTVFLRVVAAPDPSGVWRARSAGGQSSNVLSALAGADAFAVVARGRDDVPAGGEALLEMFRHPETRTRAEALGG
jgi:molybdopterin molybdotransferase